MIEVVAIHRVGEQAVRLRAEKPDNYGIWARGDNCVNRFIHLIAGTVEVHLIIKTAVAGVSRVETRESRVEVASQRLSCRGPIDTCVPEKSASVSLGRVRVLSISFLFIYSGRQSEPVSITFRSSVARFGLTLDGFRLLANQLASDELLEVFEVTSRVSIVNTYPPGPTAIHRLN